MNSNENENNKIDTIEKSLRSLLELVTLHNFNYFLKDFT